MGDIVPVNGKEKPDGEQVEVEEDDGDLHVGIIPGDACREGDEDDAYQNEDVQPEYLGIDGMQGMEMPVVEDPEDRKQKKRKEEAHKFRVHPGDIHRELCRSLGFGDCRDGKAYDKECHCECKYAVHQCLKTVF